MADTRELVGVGGAPVATYLPREPDGLESGRPLADRLTPLPGASLVAVADAAARHLAGWTVATTTPPLDGPLEAVGGTLSRRAELMTLVLDREAADAALQRPHRLSRVPRGVVLRPFGGRTPPELGAVQVAAYPAGHPDHRTDDPAVALAELRPLVDGTGGWGWRRLDASRVALRDGQAVGAAILAGRDGSPPDGGPWLAELFRLPDPELRGLGAALLDAALAAARADGLSSVGLAVSAGNPARELYASRGFATFALFAAFELPAPRGRPGPPG